MGIEMKFTMVILFSCLFLVKDIHAFHLRPQSRCILHPFRSLPTAVSCPRCNSRLTREKGDQSTFRFHPSRFSLPTLQMTDEDATEIPLDEGKVQKEEENKENIDVTIEEEKDGAIKEEQDGTVEEEKDGAIKEEQDGTSEKEQDGKIESKGGEEIVIDKPKTIQETIVEDSTKITNKEGPTPMSEIMQTENAPLGIGGKGGFTYDVNKVKKNLVQESVKQFKHEILSLLEDDSTYISAKSARVTDRTTGKNLRVVRDLQSRDEAIEDKIASLVAANPVSTTTDSNLLDGSWRFAYSSNNAEEILLNSRFVLSQSKTVRNRKRRERGLEVGDEGSNDLNDEEMQDGATQLGAFSSKQWNLKVGKTQNPFQTRDRAIYLENLRPEEYPYMLDTTSYWNGLWSVQRRYDIIGLTRTSLEVTPDARSFNVAGTEVSTVEKESEDLMPMEIQNIYLDSDLCISLVGGEKKTLNLFTKSETVLVQKTKRQLLRATISWVSSFESPLHLRRKMRSALGREEQIDEDTLSDEEYDMMLRRVYADKESKLTALRIGIVGDLSDEPVWDGEEDPFVHMSSMERQEYMKKLSIEEIKKAGFGQKQLVQKKKRSSYRKQKKFNKPNKS